MLVLMLWLFLGTEFTLTDDHFNMKNDKRALTPSPSPSPINSRALTRNRNNSLKLSLIGRNNTSDQRDTSPMSDPELYMTDNAKKDRKLNKKRCPCNTSTEGSSWLIPCQHCQQEWHPKCCNLNGIESSSVINILTKGGWKCPWCYSSMFPRPKKHCVAKAEETFLSATISTKICDNISSMITEKIENAIQKTTENLNLVSTESLSEIKEHLTDATNCIRQFSQNQPVSNNSSRRTEDYKQINSIKEDVIDMYDEGPTEDIISEYVDEEYADKISEFLNNSSFQREGNRGVLFFGAKYKYMGSNKEPKPIPEVLKPLVDKINTNNKTPVNQILVNKYTGKEAELPRHSDGERSIDPNSSIYTLSLGKEVMITFDSNKLSKKDIIEHKAVHRSMYTMSRESQNLYTHQIKKGQIDNNEVRYSITLRRIHWRNLNSTYAVGDSNFGHIKFGEGKNTVGKSTPGSYAFTPTVKDIKPARCMSYKNVVVMCGTNDLKHDEVSEEDVTEIYRHYKGKFEQIRSLNPKCNLFVCPVLPTRCPDKNLKVKLFNDLIFSDLLQSNINVNPVEGFGYFHDRNNGLLREDLHDRRSENDDLHINGKGYSILVRNIKNSIFKHKNQKGRRLGDEWRRNTARGGPRPPLRPV